jgi:hypothetical protein
MLKLWDAMSKSAQPQGRFHNPKVGGSIPPPATKIHFSSRNYKHYSIQIGFGFAEIWPRFKTFDRRSEILRLPLHCQPAAT